MNAKQLWQTALERVRTRVSSASFTTWFKATEAVAMCPGELTVAAPNSFACEHLRQRFLDVAVRAASEALGQPLDVRFVVRSTAPQPAVRPALSDAASAGGTGWPTLTPQRTPAGADAPATEHSPTPASAPIQAPAHTRAPIRAALPATTRAASPARARRARFERGARLDAPRMAAVPGPAGHGHRHAATLLMAQPALLSLAEPPAVPQPLSAAPHPASVGAAHPRQVFETFIVGTSNRLAYAAALQVATAPGQTYNPLFIYGGTGLGKTHLLLAIGQAAHAQGRTTCYVSAERFANEMIEAIRQHTTNEFRGRYREVDVLLVDDVHFIAGKEATEEEFFHTFNALHDCNRQIVLCSDRPPRAMRHLHDRLRSRFEWGLLADIQPPDAADRLTMVRAKAAELGLAASEPVLAALARPDLLSVRELEGALHRAAAYAGMLKRPLDVELVSQALAPLRAPASPAISGDTVVRAVASHFGVSLDALRGRGREQRLAWSRQVAMYLLREETTASLAQIGEQLGGRDHSTVMHGCARVVHEMSISTQTRRELDELRGALRT